MCKPRVQSDKTLSRNMGSAAQAGELIAAARLRSSAWKPSKAEHSRFAICSPPLFYSIKRLVFALCHFVIRTISESSTSSCAEKLTCCATGRVSLLRMPICRCASATFRAAVSRWRIASLNDLPPAL